VVRVSWTGNADIDVSVEEPTGSVCSAVEPRTSGGGVSLGDAYAAGSDANAESSETYVCPAGFAGKYQVRIRRVWGEVAAGKVTVDVYTNVRSGDVKHEGSRSSSRTRIRWWCLIWTTVGGPSHCTRLNWLAPSSGKRRLAGPCSRNSSAADRTHEHFPGRFWAPAASGHLLSALAVPWAFSRLFRC
jgi:hypothetical protein